VPQGQFTNNPEFLDTLQNVPDDIELTIDFEDTIEILPQSFDSLNITDVHQWLRDIIAYARAARLSRSSTVSLMIILARGEFATWLSAISQEERSLPTIFAQMFHTRFVLRIPDPIEIDLTPISRADEIFSITFVSNNVTPAPIPAQDILRRTMAHELHFRSSHTSVLTGMHHQTRSTVS